MNAKHRKYRGHECTVEHNVHGVFLTPLATAQESCASLSSSLTFSGEMFESHSGSQFCTMNSYSRPVVMSQGVTLGLPVVMRWT